MTTRQNSEGFTHDPDCIFCKIITGEIPSNPVWEDECTLVIPDINPMADTHLLVLPKQHITDFASVTDPVWFSRIGHAVQQASKALGLKDYRLVVNNGAGAGQTVFHWHTHIMSGNLRSLTH